MTAVKVHGEIDILRLPVNQEEHVFPPWLIKYTQSHILHSKCSKRENGCNDTDADVCQFCMYSRTLELPHMPDMVFPNNVLTLKHKDGATLEFNALDALKTVSNGKINVQLACAEAWKESRAESSEYLEEKIKPFDWTFTTTYSGTISSFEIQETSERIDMDKLRRRDKILFYHDLTLFEDELHDNGIAVCSVKIRVMPTSFFILLRYFLRIDGVMLRINDTRIYHEFGHNYLLREYTTREAKVEDIKAPPSLFIEPSEIAPHLPLTGSYYHKLIVLSNKSESITNEKNVNAATCNSKAVCTNDVKTDGSVT
ncbi:TIP41-like protein isoform X2 [Megachile rotundata]|uniref:TIP41-like protein isoform X2 n=1 Tax=Megachile rotundata TaxID=143995 RepID=UPI000258EA9C|nr:PREDICTED: TIP41-like protein [Megachile rotundata]XP_012145454.1 PREDICTED: TIP41-like protein [Megachile rotundata]